MTKLQSNMLKVMEQRIKKLPQFFISGRVSGIKGLAVEVEGLSAFAQIGSICEVVKEDGHVIPTEVIGIKDARITLMPFGPLYGIGPKSLVRLRASIDEIYPSNGMIGRVINAFGEPVDQKGPIEEGALGYSIKSRPPGAYSRKRVGGKIKTGVSAIDAFVTLCRGQRLGVFSGSGVGKSIMLSMCTKFASADLKVIALIGERGREVQEFIHEYLGEEGMKRAIVIVATSDEAPLMRRRAAYTAMAISEYYRDLGKHVLCIMDNVTRFAMAQREIGLCAGEPPTTKGYTPSVFVELAQLLERAGPGVIGSGDITGLFSVLVDGDDHNEPIADAVRGILDGHIVLKRSIAKRRYPAIDILESVSRTLPGCNTEAENAIIEKVRHVIGLYEDMEDMVRLGLYKTGSNSEVDRAISIYPKIEKFLKQQPGVDTSCIDLYARLKSMI